MRNTGVTLDEYGKLMDTVAKLDDVYFSAFLAVARAMLAGKDYETALSIGNTILAATGCKPV